MSKYAHLKKALTQNFGGMAKKRYLSIVLATAAFSIVLSLRLMMPSKVVDALALW